MKAGVITLIVVLVVVVIAGFFIFSSSYSSTDNSQTLPNNSGNIINNQSNTTQNQSSENGTGLIDHLSYAIEISGFAFQTAQLTINVGDSVTWTNKDSTSHTVTSDSGNELNSQLLSQNQLYSHTFTQPGTYEYHCTPHSYMKGKIVVQ